MSNKDGGPAFPQGCEHDDERGRTGMSLRDYFAGQVLSGMAQYLPLADGPDRRDAAARYAAASYVIADAMLELRKP